MTHHRPGLRALLLATSLCLTSLFAASAADESDRESWQPPGKILDAAGVSPGMTVGEVGAGAGYLTFPLAARVGESGTVYANEISEGDLAAIRARADREGIDNIVTILGEIDDPLFPERDLDLVIMVYVLHHLERPVEFMTTLKTYVRSDSPVVIVERKTFQDRSHHPEFMSDRQIVEIVTEAGYELDRTGTFLARDTIYVFKVDR